MVALPLSILAFAAGVYLLIKVKKEYLSSLFSVLAWLVIIASLAAIGFSVAEGIEDYCEDHCEGKRECHMEKKIIIRGGEGGGGYHMGEGGCSMKGCKMEGDSCAMDKEACEKMMGKEACDAMYKERGRCIMSKDECMEMCHGMKGAGGCMHHGEGMTEGKAGCCMGKDGEGKKECHKKEAK